MEKEEQEETFKKDLYLKREKNITIYNSISENYFSWIVIFIVIYIISPNNILLANFTFLLLLFTAYSLHFFSHYYDNIFTLIHKYHHSYNNFFSHFSQILLELTLPIIFIPFYLIYGNIFLDEWIIFLTLLLYCSIHNINYGQFHVNKVHSLHHKDMFTNIGPDICDVIFGTKNVNDLYVENTNHYVVNTIIIAIITYILKYFSNRNSFFKKLLIFLCNGFLFTSFLFLVIFTVYLYLILPESQTNFGSKIFGIF